MTKKWNSDFEHFGNVCMQFEHGWLISWFVLIIGENFRQTRKTRISYLIVCTMQFTWPGKVSEIISTLLFQCMTKLEFIIYGSLTIFFFFYFYSNQIILHLEVELLFKLEKIVSGFSGVGNNWIWTKLERKRAWNETAFNKIKFVSRIFFFFFCIMCETAIKLIIFQKDISAR